MLEPKGELSVFILCGGGGWWWRLVGVDLLFVVFMFWLVLIFSLLLSLSCFLCCCAVRGALFDGLARCRRGSRLSYV